MMNVSTRWSRLVRCLLVPWAVCGLGPDQGHANPTGGVVSQGSASISGIGSPSVTINQTSANAFINWNSFNLGAGETTTFNQPSSSSVTWNYISDPNASILNGNLNANGYVILQNPNGFNVGGAAVINTHGLVMTTASTPNLDLSGGGSWAFTAPPPTAKIINYGQINIAGGGSAYLIASDIENHGTISAPNGKIGLYAGQTVLVSLSPDGRGLSAQVTLPAGSVNNSGQLIADAGSIAAQAQFVNQNGLVQANSVQNVNGTIELVASGNLTLGASSQISANGDATAAGKSPGGFVVLNAGNNTFADNTGSSISVAGAGGGQNGVVEIMGSGVTAGGLKSTYGNPYALLINPYDLTLSSGAITASASPTVNLSALANYAQIDLQALDNISLGSAWTLAAASSPSVLNLSAGNNINFNNSLTAGNNWSVNLAAGTLYTGIVQPASGKDGVYLNGSSYLQSLNGDLNLWAANEVVVGSGAIRTIGGGNIAVTAEYGNVNSGSSSAGYNYYALGTGTAAKPYYTPFQLNGSGTAQTVNFNQSNLGGISTAAGGNVTINAGNNVISFPTTTVAAGDPGTGAFGPEAGNVTINAGGNVYGHFVEANGIGTLNAGQNIGTLQNNVALSLVQGSWDLNAGWNPVTQTVRSGAGNIYLQEVRNPNGVFNNTTVGLSHKPSAGIHLFNYDPQASVTLTAGNAVNLTGYDLPRPNGAVPMLLPPTLAINAGPGGVILDTPSAMDANGNSVALSSYDITLFSSAYGNLQITTAGGGGLSSGNADGSVTTLLMSDSSQTQWYIANSGAQPFSEADNASVPAELNNYQPVMLDVSGNMNNLVLQVSKLAQITVGGDLTGCSFFGQNLHAGDITSITVGGRIYNAGSFNQVTLGQSLPSASVPLADLPPGMADNWTTIFQLAVNPALLPSQSLLAVTPSQLASYLVNAAAFPGLNLGQSLAYDSNTKTLTAIGPLSSGLVGVLESPALTVVRYGPNGYPLLDANGHFVTDTIPWMPANSANVPLISYLATISQGASPLGVNNGAYVVGGTGEFDVTAHSIDLGNSDGILSVGNGFVLGRNYSFLSPYISSGANIEVTVAQDQTATVNGVTTTTSSLTMPSSTIAALGGGSVTVNSTGGTMDLGSQSLLPFEASIMNDNGQIGLGIYTSGGGNVNVTALGTINIDSSRIATFDGGNIFIQSLTGDINAGSGGTIAIPVKSFSPTFSFPYEPVEYVYANGIVADTLAPLADGSLVPGAATFPGNITVLTPQGSIYASLGGILQESLSGTLLPGPTITLEAGTPAGGDWNSTGLPVYAGSVQLGNSGVIGGTVNVRATGKVTGLLISSQNANVMSQSVGSLTVLSGGTANVSAQGSSGGGITIIGAQGVNASGIGSGATVLGQNVSVNGAAATSTLGSSASATGTSTAAAGVASSEAQQQVAGTDNGDDDQKKKKKPGIRKISRVTVIMSSAVPPP